MNTIPDLLPATGSGKTSYKVAATHGPSRLQWELARPFITKMYLEEKRPLKEIMVIMAGRGHVATIMMYKKRFTKWGLGKYNKENDMLHVVRKKGERDAIGKGTKIRVHGQVIEWEEVERYCRRKMDWRGNAVNAASTPPHIDCRTPSPSPGQMIELYSGDIAMGDADYGASMNYRGDPAVFGLGREFAQIGRGNEGMLMWTYTDTNNLLSGRLSVPRSPLPPETLLVPEHLFFDIGTYFSGCIESKRWFVNKDGYFIVVTLPGSKSELHVHSYVDFYDYCRMARESAKHSPVEFRRTLSKACGLVKSMLVVQHPRTLNVLFDTFLELLQVGLPDVMLYLQRYIGEMAEKVISTGHPWRNICQKLSSLDVQGLDQGITQAYRCTVDAFERNMGPSRSASINRLEFIERTVAATDLMAAEKLFRETIVSGVYDSQAGLFLGYSLLKQERYEEAVQIGFHILSGFDQHDGEGPRINERIDALTLVAYARYGQGDAMSAERSLRDAIDVSVSEWGISNPLTIRIKRDLEKWLREWGRAEEADQLRFEIDMAIGPDETDLEQMEAVLAE